MTNHNEARARILAERANILRRIETFGIDAGTKAALARAFPIIVRNLDRIIARFYDRLTRLPEMRRIIHGKNTGALQQKQKLHWQTLFAGKFDEDYVLQSVMIGIVHYQVRIPPHHYMAAYEFILSDIIGVLQMNIGFLDLPEVISAVNKAILLDMSISMSAFLSDALSSLAETLSA